MCNFFLNFNDPHHLTICIFLHIVKKAETAVSSASRLLDGECHTLSAPFDTSEQAVNLETYVSVNITDASNAIDGQNPIEYDTPQQSAETEIENVRNLFQSLKIDEKRRFLHKIWPDIPEEIKQELG